MCGIGGIINTNNSKIDPNIIENIKDSLEHRGPDNSSIKYISESNCFVHTRLSIIDLNDRSNQPFQSSDGRYTLVFNGEIYNYKEIRKDLESIGISFNTEGDTEVLLKGFIEHGEGILEKLRGQFAFAIYDEAEGSVFLARDRVGIKPLYFSTYKDWFVFGSEIKAIEKSGVVPFEPDIDSYVTYLRHLCVPSDRTGNKNILKLQPGEYAIYSPKNGILKKKYWNPFNFEVNNDINEKEVNSDDLVVLCARPGSCLWRAAIQNGEITQVLNYKEQIAESFVSGRQSSLTEIGTREGQIIFDEFKSNYKKKSI